MHSGTKLTNKVYIQGLFCNLFTFKN